MNLKEYKQVLGSAAVMTLLTDIVHADAVGSRVLSTHQQTQSFPEAAIMALFGLSLLGAAAFIRWRKRT